ncbi:integral membrane protein [Diplocarpon rosae]|nr:integral membrane protein [Diplocarpon rosae]
MRLYRPHKYRCKGHICATGPGGRLNSNSLPADFKRHNFSGAFTMDLTKAVGAPGVPVITSADSTGTVQTQQESDRDLGPPAPAVLMIMAFVGLMPLAVLILRVLESPKWHGVAQTISAAVALIGTGVGIVADIYDNRTKKFTSGHQRFGVTVMSAIISQIVLGFTHHRIYRRTQLRMSLARVQTWLGRPVNSAGTINRFTGVPLALNPKYDLALLACILLVITLAGSFMFWSFRRDSQQKQGLADVAPAGHQAQPWGRSDARSEISLNQMSDPPRGGKRASSDQEPVQGRRFV